MQVLRVQKVKVALGIQWASNRAPFAPAVDAPNSCGESTKHWSKFGPIEANASAEAQL